jgi:hemoglobin
MTEESIPSLFEWAGGITVFERLTDVFYRRVQEDALLSPIFEHMNPQHAKQVGHFIAEVMGGPSLYSQEHDNQGHAYMIVQHMQRHLTEQQRRRWFDLLLDCADEAGLPSDPEFRSAFVAYLEWGSRLAVINSQPGVSSPALGLAMPQWNWGAIGKPYIPKKT